MSKHTCKRNQAPTAAEPDGFAQWWAQWPSRTVAAGRRAHYAEAFAAGQATCVCCRLKFPAEFNAEEVAQLKTWLSAQPDLYVVRHNA